MGSSGLCKLPDHVPGKLRKLPRLLVVAHPQLAIEQLPQPHCPARCVPKCSHCQYGCRLPGAPATANTLFIWQNLGREANLARHKPETHAFRWWDWGDSRSRIHRFNSTIKERDRSVRYLIGASRKQLPQTPLGETRIPPLQTWQSRPLTLQGLQSSCHASHSTEPHRPPAETGPSGHEEHQRKHNRNSAHGTSL